MKHGGGTRSYSVRTPRGRLRSDGQEARVLRFQAEQPHLSVGGKAPRCGDSEQGMQVQVETYVDEGGAEKLRRFRFDSRVVEVADNIDQWHGADYRYIKVRGSDGNIYILRHNEIRAEWELTMYQRSQSKGARAAVAMFK
jgi:hypothetical protein